MNWWMNGYEAMVEWLWLGNPKYWEKNLSKCHSFQPKSHMCIFPFALTFLSPFISQLPQELFMATSCMQWNHSEADSRSTTQHVPQLLWNSWRSLQFSQKPDTNVYSKPHTSMSHSHAQFETCFNIMLLNSCRCIELIPSIQVSRVKFCYVFLDICMLDLITSIIFSADFRPCIFSLFTVVPVCSNKIT